MGSQATQDDAWEDEDKPDSDGIIPLSWICCGNGSQPSSRDSSGGGGEDGITAV